LSKICPVITLNSGWLTGSINTTLSLYENHELYGFYYNSIKHLRPAFRVYGLENYSSSQIKQSMEYNRMDSVNIIMDVFYPSHIDSFCRLWKQMGWSVIQDYLHWNRIFIPCARLPYNQGYYISCIFSHTKSHPPRRKIYLTGKSNPWINWSTAA